MPYQRYPLLLVSVLFLSILRVSHRFFIAADSHEFVEVPSPARKNSRASASDTSTQRRESFVEVVSLVHQELPTSFVDRQIPLDELESDAQLNEFQSASSTRQAAAVVPYSLWAHGHFLFLHHSRHGEVRQLIDAYRQHLIPVDAVVIDANWWHPADFFRPHPQHYPRGFQPLDFQSAGDEALTSASNVRLLLWMSTLIPSSTKQYNAARSKGYFLHGGSNRTADAHFFVWPRRDGPAISGGMLDVTNPDAVVWFAGMVADLLEANTAVAGFRCAGVDALLTSTTNLFGAAGHISAALYRSMYYRLLQDVGRFVRGHDFLIVGRAVDSFGDYHFQQFAPRDSLFAGFVGDHAFTFAGLRKAGMNIIHSAYRCYVSVGSLIGGSYLGKGEDGGVFSPDDSDVVRTGLDTATRDMLVAQSAYSSLEDSPLLFTSAKCTESVRKLRQQELFERWLQFSALLPFLSNGGLAGPFHAPWFYSSATVALYRAFVGEHRALALYYATSAARSLLSFYDNDFDFHAPYAAARSSEEKKPRRCPLTPLRRHHISFEEPVHPAEWAMMIGSDLILFPILNSFGNVSDDFGTILSAVSTHLNPATIVSHSLFPDDVSEWIFLEDPSIIALRIVNATGDTPVFVDQPLLSQQKHSIDNSRQLFSLIRRNVIIPLLEELPRTLIRQHEKRADNDNTHGSKGDVVVPVLTVFSVDNPRLARGGQERHDETRELLFMTHLSLPTAVVDSSIDAFTPAMNVTVSIDAAYSSGEGELFKDHRVAFEVRVLDGAVDDVDNDSSQNEESTISSSDVVWNPSTRFFTAMSIYIPFTSWANSSCTCGALTENYGEVSHQCRYSTGHRSFSSAFNNGATQARLLHARHGVALSAEGWQLLTTDDIPCISQLDASTLQLVVLVGAASVTRCSCLI